MRVAICDDILSDRHRLVEYIKRYIGENCIDDPELRECDCAGALLADKTMPDVSFLDIFLEAADGMAAAKQLCARGDSGGVIFPATSGEFGAASYETNALDDLDKPFSCDRFLKAIKKRGDTLSSAFSCISVSSGRQRVRLFLRELTYVEAGIHCLLLHAKRDTVKFPMTMAEADALLFSHKNFLRCHRSYIIHLNEVENVTDTTVLLTNGNRVLRSSKNAASLRRQIADFI